jgi:steroid delta-isomerase-like uncharacterized protein
MSEAENLQIAHQMWDTWNAHDPASYLKLLDEKYTLESDTVPQAIRGLEAARGFMQIYIEAFPDLHFNIDQMIASGDTVVTRWTASGAHRGTLMGIPATNRRTQTRGCSVSEIRNGKSVHDWVYWDTGNLLRQLGVLPGG